MASKFFRKAFEFIGKRGPTIKGVQPTKSKAVQDKIKLIKKAGKLQKKQKADEKNKIQKNLKEKILPKQKKKRLEELRKELK